MKTALWEIACYASGWILLTVSSFDALEKVFYGLLTGIGIASGKWLVEAFKKWKRNGGCLRCTLKNFVKR